MTNNTNIFETVLSANKDYVKAVNTGARAEVQENLLIQCRILFKTMILEVGLAVEYNDYCNHKIATTGKLF